MCTFRHDPFERNLDKDPQIRWQVSLFYSDDTVILSLVLLSSSFIHLTNRDRASVLKKVLLSPGGLRRQLQYISWTD
jgi:hypothetical protein